MSDQEALDERGRTHRYPGVRSFEDDDTHRQLFCGRDRDKYNLFQLVLAERLVVLFARSGIGKSSIINAGLMQPLRDRGCFPVVLRVSGDDHDPIASFYRGMRAELDRGVERGYITEYEPLEPEWNRTSLWHFLKTLYVWRDAKLLKPVLIFDQFEELFSLVSDEKRSEFIGEIANIVRGKRPRGLAEDDKSLSDRPPDIKVVLSLREDFMANLEEMAGRIPGILRSRFRLGPLDVEQARQAIVGPARIENPALLTPPFTWSDEALKCTLDFLRKRRGRGQGDETGNEVEPFQLQLVCQYAEDLIIDRHLSTIGVDDLGGEEALQRVLKRFYRDSIKTLCRKFNEIRLRRRLENLCEYGLITRSGRRLLREESTIAESNHISPEILGAMVDLRLIRKEPRIGDNYYELTHDTLIDPILESRERRETRKRIYRWTSGSLALIIAAWIAYEGIEQQQAAISAQADAAALQQEAELTLGSAQTQLLRAQGWVAVDGGIRTDTGGVGLIWNVDRYAENETWRGAADFCLGLAGEGLSNRSDWRLPTLSELSSIFNPEDKDQEGNGILTPFRGAAAPKWVWSNESGAEDSRAMVFDFSEGTSRSFPEELAGADGQGARGLCVSDQTTTIPNVSGLLAGEARSRIEELGLVAILMADWDSEFIQNVGAVIATEPAAGTNVLQNAEIKLKVSAPGGWVFLSDEIQDEPISAGKIVTIKRTGKNLRSLPSSGGSRIGVVDTGQTVRILEMIGDWASVLVVEDAPTDAGSKSKEGESSN